MAWREKRHEETQGKRRLLDFLQRHLDKRPVLQRVATNVGWLAADKLIGAVSGLLVAVWVARYLGPDRLGVYSYALAFAGVFSPLAQLGLGGVIIRELVREPEARPEILGTAFVLQTLSSLVTLLLTVAAVFLVRPGDPLTQLAVVIVAAGMLFRVANVLDFWFQSQIQSRYTVWAQRGALLTIAAFKVGLILLQAPLLAFVVAAAAEIVLGAGGLVFFYRRSGQRLGDWRTNWQRGRRLLADSWPLIFSGLAVGVYMRFDAVMLGQMLNERAVGLYSEAVRLTEFWYFLPMALASSVFPVIVHSRVSQTPAEHDRRMQLFFDVMTLAAYVVVIPAALLARPVVGLLYGPAYAETGRILGVYILSFVFTAVGLAANKWLLTENFTRFYMVATLLGAVVNVGLNFWWIPRFGGVGAAWATVVSYAVSGYLAFLLGRRLWPLFGQLSLALAAPLRLWHLKRALTELL